MVTFAVVAGVVVAVGVAGFLRDRVLGRRRPEPPNGAGANDPTLRYYGQVRESHQPGSHGGGLF
jgi:hypothetical protein